MKKQNFALGCAIMMAACPAWSQDAANQTGVGVTNANPIFTTPQDSRVPGQVIPPRLVDTTGAIVPGQPANMPAAWPVYPDRAPRRVRAATQIAATVDTNAVAPATVAPGVILVSPTPPTVAPGAILVAPTPDATPQPTDPGNIESSPRLEGTQPGHGPI